MKGRITDLRAKIERELNGLQKVAALSDDEFLGHFELIRDRMHATVLGEQVIGNIRRLALGDTMAPMLRMFTKIGDAPMVTISIEHANAKDIPPAYTEKWEKANLPGRYDDGK